MILKRRKEKIGAEHEKICPYPTIPSYIHTLSDICILPFNTHRVHSAIQGHLIESLLPIERRWYWRERKPKKDQEVN